MSRKLPKAAGPWRGRDGKLRRLDPVSGKTLMQTQCSVCKTCWREEGSTRCIYGGPFQGYTKMEDDEDGAA